MLPTDVEEDQGHGVKDVLVRFDERVLAVCVVCGYRGGEDALLSCCRITAVGAPPPWDLFSDEAHVDVISIAKIVCVQV